ncbi:glutathione S-transferase [Mycena polygramma]|nr:glutathione S-transferase [Mycena polygramma]
MVLRLHGYGDPVAATAIVAVTLAEKNIPFEFVSVDLAGGEHKSAGYMAMQPFGQVPVLDDEGFLLYESRAICRYIAEKYAHQGTQLIPTELKARALFEQAVSIEFSHFEPNARNVYLQAIAYPAHNLPTNQTVLTDALAALSAKLEVYEAILEKQRFIAGNEFTLADVFHIGFGVKFRDAGCEDLLLEKGPNVARWWKEITSRPSWINIEAQGEIRSTCA